jgi:hypothetical protein
MDSEDEVIVGDDHGQSETGSAKKQRRRVQPVGDDCGICYGCEEYGKLVSVYRGQLFHDTCFCGIRSYNRVIKGNPAAVAEEKANFVGNPPQWRRTVQPFFKPDGESRIQAITTLKSWIETEKYDDKQTIDDAVPMTKRKFRQHALDEDSMDEAEADASFDEQHKAQRKPLYNTFGKEVVMVAVPEVQRTIKGTRDSTITQTHQDGAAASNSRAGGRPSAPLRQHANANEDCWV